MSNEKRRVDGLSTPIRSPDIGTFPPDFRDFPDFSDFFQNISETLRESRKRLILGCSHPECTSMSQTPGVYLIGKIFCGTLTETGLFRIFALFR